MHVFLPAYCKSCKKLCTKIESFSLFLSLYYLLVVIFFIKNLFSIWPIQATYQIRKLLLVQLASKGDFRCQNCNLALLLHFKEKWHTRLVIFSDLYTENALSCRGANTFEPKYRSLHSFSLIFFFTFDHFPVQKFEM